MATDHAQPHSAHSHAAHPDDGGAGDVAAREKTKSADRGDRGFGKELASTEKKIRDKAVTKLAAWLEARGELVADDELARLWKGLFYCFWMSDKRPVQHQLAETLASIALRLRSPTSAIKYIGQFWRTLVAEWSGVDRLRIDKFYLLCRRFHRAAFRVLGKDGWSGEAVDAMCAVLGEGPLDPTSPRVPDSLRYHTAEVFFDELTAALTPTPPSPTDTSDEMTDTPNPSSLPSTPTVPIPHPSPAAATRLLRPFIAAYLTTPSTPFFTRIHDNVITPALDASSAPVSFDIAALRDALNEGAEGVMGKHKQTFLGVLERCDEILGVASAKQVREGLTGDDVEDAAEKRRKALAFLGIGVPASAAATKTSEKKKKRKREVADDGEADRVDAAVVHGENVVGDVETVSVAPAEGPDDRAGAQSDVNMEEAATDMQEDAHAPEPVTTAQVPVEGEAGLSDAAKKKRKRRKKKHAQALGAAAAAAGEGEGLNSDAMEDVRAESGKSETNPTPVALATPTSATTTAGAEEGVVTKAIKRAAASLRSETAPEMPESPADAVVPSDPDDAMWEDLPPPPKKGADEREATKSVQAAVAATQAAGGATAPATRLVKKGVKWVLEKNRVKTFHKALPVANFPSPIKKDAVPVKPVLKRRPGDVKVHPHVEKKGAKMKLKKGRR